MQKAMRLSDYRYPYAVLVSKFLLYFEVNLEDDVRMDGFKLEGVKSLKRVFTNF